MKLHEPPDRRDAGRRRARDRLLDAAAEPEARRSEQARHGQVEQLEGYPCRSTRRKPRKRPAARRDFPVDYQQLVVLGKAVPADDETASLLVQLNTIANRAGVRFDASQLEGSGGSPPRRPCLLRPPPQRRPAPRRRTPCRPPRSCRQRRPPPRCCRLAPRSALPASRVMPYNLSFSGNFFQIADFIKGLDRLVHAKARASPSTGA